MENKIATAKVSMSIKLGRETMTWVRQEAKSKRKSMASIVVGSMKNYKAAQENQEQLLAAGEALTAR